ncbi:CapA family protein, partial [Petrocella sp. FN5]|uniref:CapA family protein n=1 Tax=Petrocella sp. FN5 TaxID=3032002 RepID=UPI0023DC4809
MRLIRILTLWLMVLVILSSCIMGNRKVVEPKEPINQASTNSEEVPVNASQEAIQQDEIQIEVISETKRVSLLSVGDIMMHVYQLRRGYNGVDFDFSDSFRYVAPIIQEGDYAVGNLETTFGGVGTQRVNNEKTVFRGYSGYPTFNSPDVLAQNIKDAGFDLVSTANNHSLDTGTKGLLRTLEVLEQNKLEHIGTFRTQEEAGAIKTVDIDGIEFAMISYTYGMNGFTLKEDEDYMVNHLNMYDEKYVNEMLEKVSFAKKTTKGLVVVMLHYGNEYKAFPDQNYQKPIVNRLFEAGADIILGGHPHVLQPVALKEMVDEDGSTRVGVVIYSLGNFISSQRNVDGKGPHKDIGLIFEVIVEQVDDQQPEIIEVAYTPTYTHWSKKAITIVPTYDVPK